MDKSVEVSEMRLRDCFRRLDEIAERMGADDLDIEDALVLHEEGVALLERAETILKTAEGRVAQVTTRAAATRGPQ